MTSSYTAAPLSPLRKAIAARVTAAKQSIPHYRLTVDLAVDALLARRTKHNADTPGVGVSVNDCFVRAAGLALARHPDVNIQLVDDEIRRFDHVSLSIIVAVNGGLLTPVLHEVERKSLNEIAAETKVLVARARAGTLKMSEIAGGSFSISNLGAFGVDQFDAIINPPQCAILALGRARPAYAPAPSGDGLPPPLIISSTLSLDHRAIDGASGGDFLRTLRSLIERPDGLFATS
jgi:pyruvate dehydrogenase E2 component (dihydrolipoamide acetyltransferase)